MARTGIQFSDVEKAALELQGSGKIPTVDGVRDVLGTGSKSTISKHLRAWRTKQTEVDSTLPHELAALVTGLWTKLHTSADERIENTKVEYQQQLDALKQTCTELQEAQTDLINKLHRSEEEAAAECLVKSNLEKQLQDKQTEETRLAERALSLTKQLETSQHENTRLHQLTQHIQANLEHYQQEMHQHQLKQSMQTEKQLAFYTQEITTLKQKVETQYNQLKPLERENETLLAKLTQLEPQHQHLQLQLDSTQRQLQDTKDEKNTLLERNKAIRETLESTQENLGTITKAYHQLETRVAVLLNQNERLEKESSRATEKIETLRQEKLFLAQEKAQLEGFIKKMDAAHKLPEQLS